MSSISSVGGYSAYSPYQVSSKNVTEDKAQNVAEDKNQNVVAEKTKEAAPEKAEATGMAKMAEKIKELSNPNQVSDPQEVKTATQVIKEKAAEKAEAEEEAMKNPKKSAYDPAQALSYTSKAAMDLNVAPDKKQDNTEVKAQQEKSNKQAVEMYQQSAMQAQKQQAKEQTTVMFA